MNRHSLRFQISIFFLVMMLLINILFVYQYQYQSKQYGESLLKRFQESSRILERGRREHTPPKRREHEGNMHPMGRGFEGHLPPRGMDFEGDTPPHERERNENFQRVESLLQMKFVKPNEIPDLTNYKLIIEKDNLKIYKKKQQIYFIHQRPGQHGKLTLSYISDEQEDYRLIFFALLIDIFILAFYLYVIKRLQPLQKLKKKIIGFAQGELEVDTPQKGKDEIAEVSNEFNEAIAKIKDLQESRNLFLRNIMHELKTPIAKGKLISDLINDDKNQKRLQTIFARFEYLLNEFTKIEQVTSNAMILNKKRFRVVDIVDNAFDLLLIDSDQLDIEINDNLEIDADFELFSTALKNLIDNALKYSSKKTKIEKAKIIVDKECISIVSYGEKLKNTHFETAFNRAFEDSSRGLGLGLYITHHIVKKHGFKLEYEHKEGCNMFKVLVV